MSSSWSSSSSLSLSSSCPAISELKRRRFSPPYTASYNHAYCYRNYFNSSAINFISIKFPAFSSCAIFPRSSSSFLRKRDFAFIVLRIILQSPIKVSVLRTRFFISHKIAIYFLNSHEIKRSKLLFDRLLFLLQGI